MMYGREKYFWDRVDKSNTCWLWTGTLRGGYGMVPVTIDGKRTTMGAHRYSYLLHYEELDDRFVCHSCDNPACVRPDHLFLGSHQENMDDMYSKQRGYSQKTIAEARVRVANGESVWAVFQDIGVKEYWAFYRSIIGKSFTKMTSPPPVPDAVNDRPRSRKLPLEAIREIEKAFEKPYWGLGNKLAAKYGVDHTTISLIRHGKYPVSVE